MTYAELSLMSLLSSRLGGMVIDYDLAQFVAEFFHANLSRENTCHTYGTGELACDLIRAGTDYGDVRTTFPVVKRYAW